MIAMLQIKTDKNKDISVKITYEGSKALVSFYHNSYFISQYYADTLLEDKVVNGLCLDGGQRQFDVDVFAMWKVVKFIKVTLNK
jgi:hypothetical protein